MRRRRATPAGASSAASRARSSRMVSAWRRMHVPQHEAGQACGDYGESMVSLLGMAVLMGLRDRQKPAARAAGY
jgi:hypothetical protein